MVGSMANIGLFGAAPDTGNQGVSALCYGTIAALDHGHEVAVHDDPSALYVFDHGRGVRQAESETHLSQYRVGATTGRRIWRAEHYKRIDLGLSLSPFATPSSKAIAGLDVVLDLSGGDSFADLYGAARFDHVMRPKRLAQRLGKRLILLPQTYGPFEAVAHRDAARDAALYAERVWARDAVSYGRLQEILGADFDPKRHCLGVDMALGMTPKAPAWNTAPDWAAWLQDGDPDCIGLNISGLVANDPDAAKNDFGLTLEYSQTVQRFVDHVLAETDCRLLLIPHVLTDPATPESDIRACRAFHAQLPAEAQERVAVVEGLHDARELKWLIAQLAWFCGTRLHATIAGLSSGVPTATLAYSLKAEGIFADFASVDHCADMRQLDEDAAVAALITSLNSRDDHRSVLAAATATMLGRWADQAASIQKLIHNPAMVEAA